MHVDRGLKERHATVGGAIAELSKRLGRAPSVAEISERVESSEEEVLEAIDVGNAHHALSIDAGAPEGDDEDRPPIVESLGDSDPGYEAVEYGEAIAPILDELSKRDQRPVPRPPRSVAFKRALVFGSLALLGAATFLAIG